MADLGNCIQRAINAGELDRDRGNAAVARYREQVQRYRDQGQPEAVARTMASDDLLDQMTAQTVKMRHTVGAQLRDLAKAAVELDRLAFQNRDILPMLVEQAELRGIGLKQSFMAQMSDALAEFRTNLIGQVRGQARLKNVVRELHGQASGDATAKALADSYTRVAERARALYNALGGDIGQLQNRGVAHTHNAAKLREAGFEAWFRELWDSRALDWHRIENFETSKPFAPAQGARPFEDDARAFLQRVYEEITTEGWATREPGMMAGGRALYNRRREHRVLHFTDGDAWMRYNDRFGLANPFEAMVGELSAMARDIALMESFGPNPTAGLEYRAQIMAKQAATEGGNQTVRDMAFLKRPLTEAIDRKSKKARVMLRHVSGAANTPHDGFMASFFAGTRNLLTAAQLGGAPVSQVTDVVTMRLAAKAVGMSGGGPLVKAIKLATKGMTPKEAQAYGYIFDTWFNTGSAHARFMGDVWSPEITSRITNFVLRANGLSFMTDMNRTGLRISFSHELGEQAGMRFDELAPELRRFLENRGLTPDEWDLLRAPDAMFTSPTGAKVITPTWFVEHSDLPRLERERLAMKLGGIIEQFTEWGIPSVSTRGRATLMGDAAPGSFIGEFARSSVMYKSYALSLMFNQVKRVMEMQGNWSRATYVAAFTLQMTALGALAVQLKEIAKGRDPRPMDDDKFWAAAFMQGGGVGIFGDFFSSTTSRAGGGLGETLAGPVVGLAGDIGRAVNSNVARMANDQDPLIGRDVANLARRYNPLATFQPLVPVPTRAAMDRILWDNLQQLLDPEASDQWRRQAQQAKRDFGTQNYWQRGELGPRRAPDLSNMTGAAR